MILKSFQKKGQGTFFSKRSTEENTETQMSERSGEKRSNYVAKIDLKSLQMMTQLSSEKANKGSNDYFLQRMLSNHNSQNQNTNQSIHQTEAADSKVHFESIFSNHLSSHHKQSQDENDPATRNLQTEKTSINYAEGTSSFLANNKQAIGFRTNISHAPLNNTQLKLLMQEKNQNFDVNRHLKELNQLHSSRSKSKIH